MMTPVSYDTAYVVEIYDMELSNNTPAWDLESPVCAEFLRNAIAAGEVTEPGRYVIYPGERGELTVDKVK